MSRQSVVLGVNMVPVESDHSSNLRSQELGEVLTKGAVSMARKGPHSSQKGSPEPPTKATAILAEH